MNTVWSTYVQKIGTLYQSRKLRFSDRFQEKYLQAFALSNQKRILEIGCGPGALAESMHRWYPNAEIVGMDRDSNFIEYATQKNPEIQFVEGDIANMCFENDSFDVTISNTVAEHIEPAVFWSEQFRVLKNGGICLMLSARRGINIEAECIKESTPFEKNVWQRAEDYSRLDENSLGVCAYPQNEAELPMQMERFGFKNVTTEYLNINLTPDNPIYTREEAHAMINANRQASLDAVESLREMPRDVIDLDEVKEMNRLMNEKFDRRIALYEAGEKQWDTNVSITMVLRGEK